MHLFSVARVKTKSIDRLSTLVVAALLAASTVSAQTPPATPAQSVPFDAAHSPDLDQTPRAATPQDTPSAAPSAPTQDTAPGQPGPPVVTFRSNVRRVSVDIVVTDRNNHPVKGLTREDFQVFENGTPQPVRSFEAHVLSTALASTLPDSLHLPPNTFANLVRAPEGAPIVVLLYDVLNTPTSAMPYAHEAMVKFIKSQKSGSKIAIFVLGTRLRMLQGFTDDETRLLSVINSKATRTQQSSLLLSSDSSDVTSTDPLADAAPVGVGSSLAGLKSLEDTENAYMLQERLEATEDAFGEIARFLSTLPGRKSLLWLSGSFPSSLLPNSDPAATGTANEFGDAFDFAEQVRETNNLLSTNHISVYPIDVRGLQVSTAYSAGTIKGPGQRPNIIASNSNDAAEHGTMDSIAEATGGRAFYNTNGLLQAMQSAADEGATYYTITYAPTNPDFDGSLRKIKVQLRQAGYQLSYRRSYFADDTAKPFALARANTDTPQNPRNLLLASGMQHGVPISSELFFETHVTAVGPPMPATAKEMEQLVQFMKTKKPGKTEAAPPPVSRVQHYRVEYAILGRQLDMPVAPDGKYRTDMTFALAAYTPDSLIVNGLEVTVRNEIPTAQYQKIRTTGYHAGLDFVVPVDASAIRIAARDGIANRIGTVEVPLPLASPAPAATPAPAPQAKP